MDLLFIISSWDRLAKLRIHTESSLHVFEQVTSELGTQMRRFVLEVCDHHDTVLLPKELQARNRRKTSRKNSNDNSTSATFHLNFYKFHALGHVPQMIRQSGTTNNWSTCSVRPPNIGCSVYLQISSLNMNIIARRLSTKSPARYDGIMLHK